ncbi:trypsin alpha-3-like [Condylostylus longicornis]|uniref:trypsin alpha-3-like n=1 Tax=Condylostylus longicornis TaxID=2530218 RepID=UPI00244DB1FC|nr:trypsin alpha-3-like [Condylostylus longicornis]
MFFQILKLLVFVVLLVKSTKAQLENTTNSTLILKKNDDKIVGGQSTSITSVPYQVAITVSGSICGGSLIATNIVLTAAHCVVGRSPSSVTVRAGSNYYNRNGVLLPVSRILSNYNFNFQTMTHDIAMLKLSRSLTASEMSIYGIQTIQLQTTIPQDNSLTKVSGYGRLSSQGSLASTLQSVTVTLINWSQCNQRYNWRLTSTMICAGHFGGGRDACQGDSGGPLAYEGKLLGIVSWGYGCASAMYPGIYTSVPALYGWIQSSTAEMLRFV